jgi:RNA polymerase sigma-70 factor, ECF subfamily
VDLDLRQSVGRPTHEEQVSTLTAPREAGDTAWFSDAVVAILPELYGTARRLTKNPADAEDLVAEAVARAWRAHESLSDSNAFRHWIHRILANTYASWWRSARVRPVEEPLTDEDSTEDRFSLFERLHQPFLLWFSTPEQEFLNKLLREDLERAIDQLPETFRGAVVLADVQGLSYQEIAHALRIPIGTVRSRLARGRAALQKALWQHGVDAGLVRAPGIRSNNV